MKKFYLLITFAFYLSVASAQHLWKTNIGIEGGGWWGMSGMSSLKQANNPLANSNLGSSYSVSADFYADFLSMRKRTNAKWGSTAPGFGIKTKLDWEYFYADNSSSGGGESIGMNYLDVPILFEYCLSFHEGVTRAGVTPENSTTSVYDHTDYTHIITVTTPSHYNPGGAPTSTATFIYAGPQICYLFKSFHNTGSINSSPINDPNLRNSYIGLVAGFTFWLNQLNFDLSYQKGLQSIYSGKDLYINGFLFKVGINFNKRLFNQH
jgi:hypothetical protein